MEQYLFPVSKKIVNPAWKKIDSKVRSLNSKIAANSVKFTKIELHPESAPKLLKLQLKRIAEIVEEINNLKNELDDIKGQRRLIAKHITQVSDFKFSNLEPRYFRL